MFPRTTLHFIVARRVTPISERAEQREASLNLRRRIRYRVVVGVVGGGVVSRQRNRSSGLTYEFYSGRESGPMRPGVTITL